MVECQLPKLDVAGSSPVARSFGKYLKIKDLRRRVCPEGTPVWSSGARLVHQCGPEGSVAIDPSTIGATLKAIGSVVSQFSDTPLKQQVIDLQNLLIQLQSDVIAMQVELADAHSRTRDLEARLATRSLNPRDGLAFERGVWWASDSREHDENGPFCPACLDDGHRRSLRVPNGVDAQCPKCETWYTPWPERRKPAQQAPRSRNWLTGY